MIECTSLTQVDRVTYHVLSVIPRPSPAPVMVRLEPVRACNDITNHSSVGHSHGLHVTSALIVWCFLPQVSE